MNQEKQKPVKKFRIGNVEAAVWRRERENGYRSHSVSFQRSYRSKEGGYRSVSDFNSQEIFVLIEVARLASQWMLENDALPVSVSAESQ